MERFLENRKDKDEEGSVIILVAVLMVVFLGMAALVVDLGADYVYKAKMQTACDTASRAELQPCLILRKLRNLLSII